MTYSVNVACFEYVLVGSLTTLVLSCGCLAVSLGVRHQLILGLLHVLLLTHPGLEHSTLESSSVREGQSERTATFLLVLDHIHRVQVKRSLLLGLAA